MNGARHTRTWTEVSSDTRNMILAIVLSAAVLLGLGEGVVGDGVEEGVTAGVGD